MTNFIDYHKPDTWKGELMKQDKPLIDYINHHHKRCDDDLRLAEKLIFASKCFAAALCCFALLLILSYLAMNAAGVVK